MHTLNKNITLRLRQMVRDGETASKMFDELKTALGPDGQIVLILDYLRSAFFLSLAEVKPIAAFSRNDSRVIDDEATLNQLVMPSIAKKS